MGMRSWVEEPSSAHALAHSSMPHAEQIYASPSQPSAVPSPPSPAVEPRSPQKPNIASPPQGALFRATPLRQRTMPPPSFGAVTREARATPSSPGNSPLQSPRVVRQLQPLDQPSEELLLLGSSHRVAAEGARGGA